jgi:hypothetical protein
MLKIYNSIEYASRNHAGSFAPTHAERVAALNDETIFQPDDFIRYTLFPWILLTVVSLSLIYTLSFRFVDNLVQDDATFQKKRKVCYQMTNLLVNACLGGMGLYYDCFVTPADVPLEEKITGFAHYYLLSCLQMGFQLWSIRKSIGIRTLSVFALSRRASGVDRCLLTTFFISVASKTQL